MAKLEEKKEVIATMLQGGQSPLSGEERVEAEKIKQQQSQLEFEDEIIRQKFNMDYNRSNPTSFEEYKKKYLAKKHQE